jgi:peptidoglycan/xylan/chitin deacetylase (PgdA/CDA1 family)
VPGRFLVAQVAARSIAAMRSRLARLLGRALLYVAALGGGASIAAWLPPRAAPADAELSRSAATRSAETPASEAPDPAAALPASASIELALRDDGPESPVGAPVIDVDADHAPVLSPAERATGGAYRDGMIITGSTPHRLILFTFDDGPDPATTPLLLDRLDAAGIKAVFFLVGNRIAGTTPIERRQAVIAREIVRRGHLVGGHTLDHVQLPLLDDAKALEQLTRSDEIFQQVFGSRARLFRPPFGAHSQRIDQYLAARGYTTVLWNLGTGDFQVRTAEEVYRTWLKVFERREREYGDRGGIILLHDTHPWSVDAFQMIVSHLMARNCELLDSGEELFDIVDDLDFFHVPRGDAAPEVEAPAVRVADALLAERQARLRESTARRCKALAAAF